MTPYIPRVEIVSQYFTRSRRSRTWIKFSNSAGWFFTDKHSAAYMNIMRSIFFLEHPRLVLISHLALFCRETMVKLYTATYSCKLACLAILHASTCSCKCKPICFFSAMASHNTELSQVLTTLADVVWLISWSLCSSRAASGVQILMCNRMCRSRTHGWRSWCNVSRSSCNHETTSDPYDPHLIAWTRPSRRYTLLLP